MYRTFVPNLFPPSVPRTQKKLFLSFRTLSLFQEVPTNTPEAARRKRGRGGGPPPSQPRSANAVQVRNVFLKYLFLLPVMWDIKQNCF